MEMLDFGILDRRKSNLSLLDIKDISLVFQLRMIILLHQPLTMVHSEFGILEAP